MKRPLMLAGLALISTNTWSLPNPEIFQLSLEELMSIEVTSVAKKSQRLSDAAAAVYVITADDMRQAGVTNLPEALRLAPGVQVARIDGSRYAVSIRGFSSRFNSKLLVLMDGRTVYTPLFSGVYWEVQDLVLDDVERIEVIRGPGGTLWGANAVTGVINIITKSAKDTQGGLLEAHGGNIDRGGALRYGGKLGESGYFRAYAKFSDNNELKFTSGGDAHDASDRQQAGFRIELAPSGADALTLQGDAYKGRAQQTGGVSTLSFPAGTYFLPDTADNSGANVLFRWRHTLSQNSDWQLQAYFDHTSQQDAVLDQRIDTADIEFQHRFPLSDAHDITWGAGYRHIRDDLNGSFTLSFSPEQKSSNLFSAFVQDEIRLQDNLRLTLGSKFEHNDYSGFEYQPSARLLWRPTKTDTWWAAVSRAVRTPSRTDHDATLNYLVFPGGAIVLQSQSTPAFESENLLATEIGYRGQFGPNLSMDATVFHHDHSNLRTRSATTVIPGFPQYWSQSYVNDMEGSTQGVELTGNLQVSPTWRLRASYSFLDMDMRLTGGSTDAASVSTVEGSVPRHMAQLHSQHDLGHNVQLNASLYYTDRLPYLDIDHYTRFDLRLAWQATRDLELSLTGQNLFDPRHVEYDAVDVTASAIPRSVLALARLRF